MWIQSDLLGGRIIRREIPPVKAKPESIPYLLKIIGDNEGNYKAITKEVYQYLCSLSDRGKKPSVKNSVRAVALPTLRHLKLIRGGGNNVSLTSRGHILLENSLDRNGNVSTYNFRRHFAEYILRLERRYFIPISDISENMIKSIEEPIFDVHSLLERIEKEFGEKAISADRLRRWLSYLRCVGFMENINNSDMLRLNKHQIKASERREMKPTELEFRRKLIDEYYKLSPLYEALGYVAIPKLRHRVCVSFNGLLWDEDFDFMLEKIKKEDEKYVISFAEPMTRKSGGLYLSGKYYYYIFIRSKKQRDRYELQ